MSLKAEYETPFLSTSDNPDNWVGAINLLAVSEHLEDAIDATTIEDVTAHIKKCHARFERLHARYMARKLDKLAHRIASVSAELKTLWIDYLENEKKPKKHLGDFQIDTLYLYHGVISNLHRDLWNNHINGKPIVLSPEEEMAIIYPEDTLMVNDAAYVAPAVDTPGIGDNVARVINNAADAISRAVTGANGNGANGVRLVNGNGARLAAPTMSAIQQVLQSTPVGLFAMPARPMRAVSLK